MSEIRVDTISEKTSANGVAVDGVTIKDGGITVTGAAILNGGIDVAGDITLDAGGGSVFLKDDGAFIGQLSNSSSDFAIVALAQDKDIILKGNDGGSGITALTLDMSNAGRAVFNDGATFNNNVYLGDDDKLIFGGGDDLKIYHDGSNSIISNSTGRLDLRGANISIKNLANSEFMLQATENGAVDLYHNNVKKLETSAAGISVTGAGTFTTADNSDTLTLTSTDADANAGPNLRLYRNSANPADSDTFGQIDFEGRNDNSQDFVATQIKVNCGDVSDGNEGAQIEFDVMTGGTLREYMRMAAGSNPSVIINQDSRDINFQVLSDGNDNMLFVDGGNNKVGIGTGTPADALHIKAGNGIIRLMEATQADTKYAELESSNGRLFLHSDRGNAESGSDMRFHIDNSEKVRIHSNGNVSIPGGVELGSGLDATAANLLDDYEEGTWTPAWASGSNGRSISGTGGYTKIGNLVTVFGKFTCGGSNNTGSGDVQFSGLPFTAANVGAQRSAISIFVHRCASAVDGYISGFVKDNEQTFTVREGGIVADGNDLGNHFDQDTEFWLNISYRV